MSREDDDMITVSRKRHKNGSYKRMYKGMSVDDLNDGFKDYIRRRQREAYMKNIGKVFGDYRVVRIAYDEKNRCQVWKMQCTHCGRYWCTRSPENLKSGKSGRCYCMREKRKAERRNAALSEDNGERQELGAVPDGNDSMDSSV